MTDEKNHLTEKTVAFMAVGGHEVDAETRLLLEQLDTGLITHEQAIKVVEQKLTQKRTHGDDV